MNCHQVHHIPSTAFTQDCLSSIHSDDCELTPEWICSIQRASLHGRLPSASSPWALLGNVTLSHSHGCDLTTRWKESQRPVGCPSTAAQYWSKLALLRPPSACPNLLNYTLQVHLQTSSVTASKWISKLARAEPPGVSPTSLDYGLEVHKIMDSNCIYTLAQSRSRSASLHSIDHILQVYLWIHLSAASKFIFKLTRSRPRGVSLCSPHPDFQAHLKLLFASPDIPSVDG